MQAFSVIPELLRAGNKVRFRVRGSSMAGAIDCGDVVEAEPVQVADLRVSDVELYQRYGRLVAHRLLAFEHSPALGLQLVVRGDNHSMCDTPVPLEAVLGRVTVVRRGLGLPRLLLSVLRALRGLWDGSLRARLT